MILRGLKRYRRYPAPIEQNIFAIDNSCAKTNWAAAPRIREITMGPIAQIFPFAPQNLGESVKILCRRLANCSRFRDPKPGPPQHHGRHLQDMLPRGTSHQTRSEEHTSELQSLMRNSYAVFCLKKKN